MSFPQSTLEHFWMHISLLLSSFFLSLIILLGLSTCIQFHFKNSSLPAIFLWLLFFFSFFLSSVFSIFLFFVLSFPPDEKTGQAEMYDYFREIDACHIATRHLFQKNLWKCNIKIDLGIQLEEPGYNLFVISSFSFSLFIISTFHCSSLISSYSNYFLLCSFDTRKKCINFLSFSFLSYFQSTCIADMCS